MGLKLDNLFSFEYVVRHPDSMVVRACQKGLEKTGVKKNKKTLSMPFSHCTLAYTSNKYIVN